MANPWFRFYGEVINDPKVQSMRPELFKFWVNLLCVASNNAGLIPVVTQLVFEFRLKKSRILKLLGELKERGLVDDDEEGLRPHNWSKRQYKSDTSTQRVQDHRERKKQDCNVSGNVSEEGAGNVSCNGIETPPDNRIQITEEKNKDLTTASYSAIDLLAQKFYALFAADGYFLNKVNNNPDTVQMIKAWIAAGVTVEEAKAIIEQTKAKRGGKKPSAPFYYRDIVLEAKRAGIVVVERDLQEQIKALFHEILPKNPVNVWTTKAAKDLQARINGTYERMDMRKLSSWRNFFLVVKACKHVKSYEWQLDYLVREEVFAAILNNKRDLDFDAYEKLKGEI